LCPPLARKDAHLPTLNSERSGATPPTGGTSLNDRRVVGRAARPACARQPLFADILTGDHFTAAAYSLGNDSERRTTGVTLTPSRVPVARAGRLGNRSRRRAYARWRGIRRFALFSPSICFSTGGCVYCDIMLHLCLRYSLWTCGHLCEGHTSISSAQTM